jgi:ribose transport system ATP-binding protein
VDELAQRPLLELRSVSKIYPGGTHALKDVSMGVRPGLVNGLVGGNGAGKSTLIKIIAGAESPTRGTVSWRGEPAQFRRPADAVSAGIAVVHQQSPVAPGLNVIENVYLGHGTSVSWLPSRRLEHFRATCRRLDYVIDPFERVGDLSIGDRQMVSILRALATGAAMIVLDEPTASIGRAEREAVLSSARRLADNGTAVVFVSHFLDEIVAICDRVSVLRDGRLVDEMEEGAVDERRILRGIVGERLEAIEKARPSKAMGKPVLEVSALTSSMLRTPIDVQLRAGEIVGLAGLLGSGRTELLRSIFGADRRVTGTVTVEGRAVAARPGDAVRAGMAFVPEDRAGQGLIPEWEIWRNISLSDLGGLSRSGILDVGAERRRAQQACEDLGIVAESVDTPVGRLSGGNAQKVVFAKWIYRAPNVLLLDEPTAGIDVGGKADLIKLIRDLASRGAAILVAISDFDELLSVADRVLVMRHGDVVRDVEVASIDTSSLTAMVGGLQ